jgi:hypothetical protein
MNAFLIGIGGKCLKSSFSIHLINLTGILVFLAISFIGILSSVLFRHGTDNFVCAAYQIEYLPPSSSVLLSSI